MDEILEIAVWYKPSVNMGDLDQVIWFQTLVRAVQEAAPLLRELVFKDEFDEVQLDLNSEELAKQYVSWLEKFLAKYGNEDSVKIIGGSRPFQEPSGNVSAEYFLGYMWDVDGAPDTVRIDIPLVFADTPGMAQVVTDLVRVLTAWRPAQAVVAFPSMLKMSGKVFRDYHSSGFGIWLAESLDGIDLSDAHSVTRINDGTLILTAPEMFNLANAEAIARYQSIDGHLVQAGVMPRLSDGPILF